MSLSQALNQFAQNLGRYQLLVMKGDVAMTIADSLSTYASAEAVGKTLHALPTDTVLHTEADFDDFEREMLDDD